VSGETFIKPKKTVAKKEKFWYTGGEVMLREFLADLWYLVPRLFLAGVLDGIAGGGGIIALPAYMLTGMPVHSAYACNKLQSGLGTFCSCYKYMKEKFADIKMALIAVPSTMVASLLATRLVMNISTETVKIIIAVCIPIAVIMMFLKRKVSSGQVRSHRLTTRNVLLSLLAGLLLGAYDALFGPGGGTIAMILFSLLMNYDLRVGNGNGKIVIVASNLMAVINYIAGGYMIWHIAIPCAAANMVGGYLGASIVIKKGEKVIFPAMMAVLATLIGQTVFGMLR
jgi:uncharacterized membrane protein YfcA